MSTKGYKMSSESREKMRLAKLGLKKLIASMNTPPSPVVKTPEVSIPPPQVIPAPVIKDRPFYPDNRGTLSAASNPFIPRPRDESKPLKFGDLANRNKGPYEIPIGYIVCGYTGGYFTACKLCDDEFMTIQDVKVHLATEHCMEYKFLLGSHAEEVMATLDLSHKPGPRYP